VHGSIYEVVENRNFNANDQAAARQNVLSPPRYDQNHLGAEAGGPVLKNKLFVYGLYEYNPIGQAGVPSSPVYAPTAAGYAALDSMTNISKTNLGILEKYAPATGATATPSGLLPTDCVAATP